MQAEDRHEAILEILDARGSISIRELAEELGVAAVTIRVDVRELAGRGLLARVHGGARKAARPDDRPEVSQSENGKGTLTATRGSAVEPAPESGKPYTLGLVVPHPSYYYPAVVAGARAAADRLGARLQLSVSRNTVSVERAQVEQMVRSGVQGLIITTVADPRTSPETQTWLADIPVPVVLAERRVGLETGAVEHVATDHEYGAYLAVRHLAALGRTRIALVMLDTKTAPMLRSGYEAALKAFGLDAVPAPPVFAESDAEAFERACEQLVGAVRAGEVDAAIIHNDSLAIPMLSRVMADGVDVPGDLSVMAYDDELASMADPPLSAIAPPRHDVGAEAVTMLLQRLMDPVRPPHHLLLRPALRVRLSCGAASADQVRPATGDDIDLSPGERVAT